VEQSLSLFVETKNCQLLSEEQEVLDHTREGNRKEYYPASNH